jgi:hypothetical protein
MVHLEAKPDIHHLTHTRTPFLPPAKKKVKTAAKASHRFLWYICRPTPPPPPSPLSPSKSA